MQDTKYQNSTFGGSFNKSHENPRAYVRTSRDSSKSCYGIGGNVLNNQTQLKGRYTMDIHSEYVDITSSTYENVSFSKAEDSGYHTSTPSSFECDELANQYFNSSIINITISSITRQNQLDFNQVTPEKSYRLYQPCSHSTGCNVNLSETPINRRGLKRPYPTEEKIETPTSFIAGKIKSLDVNGNKENSKPISPECSINFDVIDRSLFFHHDAGQIASYPSTPVKRNCNRQTPCRRSVKKIQFATHSLSCETTGLQYSDKPRIPSNIDNRSEHKVDVITKLLEAQYMPPIENILNYLSDKDIQKFCLVSHNWNNTWKLVSRNNKRKKDYLKFLKIAKQNRENRKKTLTPAKNAVKLKNYLKEINNEFNDNPVLPERSPPGTPRTNRFKKFTKSASLDSCTQISCVRCNGPAKVKSESSGEVWAECKSIICSYQFCKDCSCDRHPGKCCSQYDLSCPSPSKRKKSDHGIGTKKSRRNLRRL